MSFLGKLFSTPKIIDAAINAGDAIVFTDEEKKKWALDYLKATEHQSLSRRYISVVVVVLWAFLVLLGVVFYPFSKDYSQFLFEILKEIVMTPFVVVVGFYFATQTLKAVVGK